MYCSNCGKEIQEGVKYCPYCGAQLTQIVARSSDKVTEISDEFLNNLVSLNDLVIKVENLQHGIDLCNIVIHETSPSRVFDALKNTVKGTIIGGGLGGIVAGIGSPIANSINSAKAEKELKNNYGIKGFTPSAFKKGIDNLENQINSTINNNVELFKIIPTRYMSSICLNYLITAISEKRVKTMNEVLDKLDQQIHNWIIENKLCDIETTVSYWKLFNIYVA